MVENAGSAGKVKAGIVYQQDDYGKDGLAGLKAAAEKAGARCCRANYCPGQKDGAVWPAGCWRNACSDFGTPFCSSGSFARQSFMHLSGLKHSSLG